MKFDETGCILAFVACGTLLLIAIMILAVPFFMRTISILGG